MCVLDCSSYPAAYDSYGISPTSCLCGNGLLWNTDLKVCGKNCTTGEEVFGKLDELIG